MKYDYLEEQYDIVIKTQKGTSKSISNEGNSIDTKRKKSEKKKNKNKSNPYNSKFVRTKINKTIL